MGSMLQKGFDYIGNHGLVYTLKRVGEKAVERFLRPYDKLWREMKPTEAVL